MEDSYEAQARLHAYITIVGFSILVYDHLITLEDEVTYIWTRPKHASNILYLVNRYLGDLATVVQIVALSLKISPQGCIVYLHCRQILLFMSHFLVCALALLRTYALYGQSRCFLFSLLAFSAILLSVSVWSLIGQHVSAPDGMNGCEVVYGAMTAIYLAVPYECLFLFDTVIYVLTVYKAYKVGQQASTRLPTAGQRLTMLLVRDGAVYFAILAIATLANVISFYIAPPLMKGGLSTFSICISITMVSRLLLNLHRTADVRMFSTYTRYPHNTIQGSIILTTHIDLDEGCLSTAVN